MPYATEQDLIDRFGAEELAQLTDRVNGAAIDSVIVARALADADAEIDAYLAARYALPLAAVPAVLPKLAADIARYHLYADRATEAVRQRYEDALRLLKALAKGDSFFPEVPAVAADSVAVAARAPAAIFDADGLSGY